MAHAGLALQLGGWGRAKACASDKLNAFEEMVARDWDRFWRYAYRLCGNADDAEDLLSESLMEAFQAFDRYTGRGFDKWVFHILTTNRIDMTRRAKLRRTERLDAAWDAGSEENAYIREIPDEQSDPQRLLLDPLFSENMQKALDALPDDFRAAILLCDVEQMEYADIARALGVPLGTVRSRIHRARGLMRKSLESLGRHEQ